MDNIYITVKNPNCCIKGYLAKETGTNVVTKSPRKFATSWIQVEFL